MSGYSFDKPPLSRPPLGERPDFDKLDRMNAEKDSQLAYIHLDQIPALRTAYYLITQDLNNIRIQVGAPEIPDDTSMVRLMNYEQWNALSGNSGKVDSSAHYDPLSGNIYQLLNVEGYISTGTERIFAAYTMAHELSHKATHGLEKYSFHLSEGLADFLAQQALENGALEPFIPKDELDYYRQSYLEAGPVIIEGFECKAEDIFVIPDEQGSGFTRIPQLRIIQALQATMHPELFNTFLQGSFTDDIRSVKWALTEQFGEELASSLDDVSGSADPRQILSRILQ